MLERKDSAAREGYVRLGWDAEETEMLGISSASLVSKNKSGYGEWKFQPGSSI